MTPLPHIAAHLQATGTPTAPDLTRHLMTVADKPPVVFRDGRGDWLHDTTGRRHLDWVQGWAVNTLGHAPPELARALAAQAGLLLQAGPGFHNETAAQLAERLARLSGLERVFFTSSGAEANEGAIKLARKWGRVHRGGAFEIITLVDSFHGRTLATMSASGKPGFDTLFAPQIPGFPKARMNDLDSVAARIGPRTAAILLEPVQGEAGVVCATPAFLQGVRALCDQHGLLLMLDEVQTGIGRLGTLFGHEAAGIVPDVMTLGKGLGGGVPLGALLAREAVCCFEPGDQGGTYCGNALSCAAGLAVLEVVTAPGFLDGVRQRGERLRAGLQALVAHEAEARVHGQGMLLALERPQADWAPAVARALLDRPGAGMLVNAPRPRRLRVMPALNLGDEALSTGLAWLGEALVPATR